jgi:translocation and assembly module TamA
VIGPVRLDVAFPLQDRDGVDDAFQVYISIGQSF